MLTFVQKRKLYFYFYILIFVIILIYILSHSCFGVCIGFHLTNDDSAESLISTLIQSEAAVLAIVITLSLVAVQQTASSYSPRVIEVFKDMNSNPDFYLLMFIYSISIMYEIWVLKQINTDRFGVLLNFKHSLFNSFEAHIWISYALGVFSLLSLVPYTQNTLDLLKPSNVIERISEKISKDTIESFVSAKIEPIEQTSEKILQATVESSVSIGMYEKDFLPPEESEETNYDQKSSDATLQQQIHTKNSSTKCENFDLSENPDDNPIRQIFDIVTSSQTKYDFETSKNGLTKIIISIDNFTEGKIYSKFHREIVKSFGEIVRLSLILKDFESSFLLTQYLGLIGIKAVEQKIEPVVIKTLKCLYDISVIATEQKLEDIAIWATSSITKIGIKALNEDLNNRALNKEPFNNIVTEIEMNLRFVGKKAAEQRLEKEILFIVQYLRDIGRASINKKLIFETRQSVKYLEEIGRLSIRQELEEPITMIGILLDELSVEALNLDPGEKASKQQLKDFEVLIAVSSTFIGNFGKLAAEQHFEYTAKSTVITLKKVGVYIAQRKFEIATTASLSAIKGIGVILAEQKIDHAVETTVLSLRNIGEISIHKGMNNQAGNALSFIDDIGNLSIRRNMGNSTKSVIQAFSSFGKSAIEKNLEYTSNGIITSIERAGIAVIEQKMDFVAKKIIEVLQDIAEFSITSRNESVSRQCIQSIEEIGKASISKKLEISINGAVLAIKEVGFKAIQQKMNPVVYQSLSSLENIEHIAIDAKLFNNSTILESLKEFRDNVTILL